VFDNSSYLLTITTGELNAGDSFLYTITFSSDSPEESSGPLPITPTNVVEVTFFTYIAIVSFVMVRRRWWS
jgi:hypothetical protein